MGDSHSRLGWAEGYVGSLQIFDRTSDRRRIASADSVPALGNSLTSCLVLGHKKSLVDQANGSSGPSSRSHTMPMGCQKGGPEQSSPLPACDSQFNKQQR